MPIIIIIIIDDKVLTNQVAHYIPRGREINHDFRHMKIELVMHVPLTLHFHTTIEII